uniref:NHL repeat containing protein n=1 Tax=Cyanothece sp. (strain PCC 7425 / ATCC 29141) TaxID=395961 RepID=B8HW80_CYAP4
MQATAELKQWALGLFFAVTVPIVATTLPGPIAPAEPHRLAQVSSRAKITKVIANNLGNPIDVAVANGGKNFLVTDGNRNRLLVLDARTGKTVKAYTGLTSPYGVAATDQYYYVSELINVSNVWYGQLKRINPRTRAIKLLRTTGPGGRIFANSANSLFVPFDYVSYFFVLRYSQSQPTFRTIHQSTFEIFPTDIQPSDGIYLVTSLSSNGCLVRVESGIKRRTIACHLGRPQSIVVLNGAYFVSDDNGRLLRISSSGQVSTLLNRGLGSPGGMVAYQGKLLLTDMAGGRLLEITL